MTTPYGTRVLITIQAVVVAAYGYGLIAFLSTDAEYFPEQAPPTWALPAVLATLFGPLLAVITLLVAGLLLRRPSHRNPLLIVATVATALAFVVMVSPLGWEVFDWYVS